ncbi:MAG: NAD(P)/FAD-dependent oxidoreductase [Cyanobacteriota bacterium]|nr:NAD(P)/FAD-dependent oxidoreductase [Cyanobacteriota bacterium]
MGRPAICYGRSSFTKLDMTRIGILGGGFGGLYTALELGRYLWPTPPEITLVDRQERFVFLPLLYEVVTGEMEDWEVAPRFTELLAASAQPNTPIRFRQAEVAHLDLAGRRVIFQDGNPLDYDILVVALGGDPPLTRVAGAEQFAFPFRQLADAQRLRAALPQWQQGDPQTPIRLAITGAGASGVELACKLADRLGERAAIRLIEMGSQILPGFGEASRQAASQALQQRQIHLELQTQVLSIQSNSIQTQTQSETGYPQIRQEAVDGVIWTAGWQVVPMIRDLPVAKNERQRLVVDATLRLPDYPEVFAIGDSAAVQDADGKIVPASAQAAFQQADYCAWNVWATATQSRPLLPFRYYPLGEMLSLGTDTAVLSGLGLTLTGSLGYLARRATYLARMPTFDHQLKVGWHWMAKPLLTEWQRWVRSS